MKWSTIQSAKASKHYPISFENNVASFDLLHFIQLVCECVLALLTHRSIFSDEQQTKRREKAEMRIFPWVKTIFTLHNRGYFWMFGSFSWIVHIESLNIYITKSIVYSNISNHRPYFKSNLIEHRWYRQRRWYHNTLWLMNTHTHKHMVRASENRCIITN